MRPMKSPCNLLAACILLVSVDGNISSPTFGRVVRAAPPRIGQVAVKFNF